MQSSNEPLNKCSERQLSLLQGGLAEKIAENEKAPLYSRQDVEESRTCSDPDCQDESCSAEQLSRIDQLEIVKKEALAAGKTQKNGKRVPVWTEQLFSELLSIWNLEAVESGLPDSQNQKFEVRCMKCGTVLPNVSRRLLTDRKKDEVFCPHCLNAEKTEQYRQEYHGAGLAVSPDWVFVSAKVPVPCNCMVCGKPLNLLVGDLRKRLRKGSVCNHIIKEDRTLEHLLAVAEENDVSVDLSTVITTKNGRVSKTNSITFPCKKNPVHVRKVDIGNFLNNPGCPECDREARRNVTRDKTRDNILSEGFQVTESFEEDYVDTESKFDVVCNEDPCHVFQASGASWRQGDRCPHCAVNKKKTREEVIELVHFQGHSFRHDNWKYVDRYSMLPLFCRDKHHVWDVPVRDIFRNVGCRVCHTEKRLDVHFSNKNALTLIADRIQRRKGKNGTEEQFPYSFWETDRLYQSIIDILGEEQVVEISEYFWSIDRLFDMDHGTPFAFSNPKSLYEQIIVFSRENLRALVSYANSKRKDSLTLSEIEVYFKSSEVRIIYNKMTRYSVKDRLLLPRTLEIEDDAFKLQLTEFNVTEKDRSRFHHWHQFVAPEDTKLLVL